VGQTRVDLQHLLEDLRGAYTGALEETILTEIIANALDSGATRIQLRTDPANATLSVVDDGVSMQRRDLARYHDVAAGTRARGDGTGFAGVGIKLGLLVASEVVTETQRAAPRTSPRGGIWHRAIAFPRCRTRRIATNPAPVVSLLRRPLPDVYPPATGNPARFRSSPI
jgi:hypothetical protein